MAMLVYEDRGLALGNGKRYDFFAIPKGGVRVAIVFRRESIRSWHYAVRRARELAEERGHPVLFRNRDTRQSRVYAVTVAGEVYRVEDPYLSRSLAISPAPDAISCSIEVSAGLGGKTTSYATNRLTSYFFVPVQAPGPS